MPGEKLIYLGALPGEKLIYLGALPGEKLIYLGALPGEKLIYLGALPGETYLPFFMSERNSYKLYQTTLPLKWIWWEVATIFSTYNSDGHGTDANNEVHQGQVSYEEIANSPEVAAAADGEQHKAVT